MKPKNDKNRIFEVMGRLDKTFKPKLNEYSNYPDMGEDKTLTEATNLQQLNDDMQMIIGDLVSSSSEEEFAAKVNDIAMQYVPEEHVNNPSALDFTKRFILRKFKTDPSVRDAFGNMIQYAENIGATLNEQGAGGDAQTPIEKMDDIEFKNQIKNYVDGGDFDGFHYLMGNAHNAKRYDLVSSFIFDFDADYSLMKHLFSELAKIKDSGFWTNHTY